MPVFPIVTASVALNFRSSFGNAAIRAASPRDPSQAAPTPNAPCRRNSLRSMVPPSSLRRRILPYGRTRAASGYRRSGQSYPVAAFTRLWHPSAFLPCQSNEFSRLLLASEFRRKDPPYAKEVAKEGDHEFPGRRFDRIRLHFRRRAVGHVSPGSY